MTHVFNKIDKLILYIDQYLCNDNNISFPPLVEPFVSIEPILTGTLELPQSMAIKNGTPNKNDTVTCLCYLIKHQNNKDALLFDAGLSKELNKNNYGKLSKHSDFFNMWNIKMDKNFLSLSDYISTKLNINISDIRNIILSHYHWDHCGDINDFPDSKLIMGNGVNSIRNKCTCSQMYGGKHAYFGFEIPKVKEINEVKWKTNTLLFNGLFNKYFDLYNDGSVYIIDGPGHVQGHIMLLLKTKNGWRLLVGDAVQSTKSYKGIKPIGKGLFKGRPADQDPIVSFETIKKIHKFHNMDNTLVCPAHLTLDEFDELKLQI